MKIRYFWKNEMPKEEIEIHSHPVNTLSLKRMESVIDDSKQLAVTHPISNRKVFLSLSEIERIESFGHLCKVFTDKDEEYLIQKRLKAVIEMEFSDFYRINNSSVLNLTKIKSFSTGDNARLEVHTASETTHVVSRHYAKIIKEKLR